MSKPKVQSAFLAVLLGFGSIAAHTAQGAELVAAAKGGDLPTVRALIAEGVADVNETDAETATSLLWAAHRNDLETARLLLDAGADANLANRYNVTPLHEAITWGNAELVGLLLAAGADPEARAYESGETPLMTAARTGNIELMTRLLDSGVDVNATESWRGQNALMWAVVEHHADAVKLLIDHGTDVNTPSRFYDFQELEWAAGNVPRERPHGGLTALHYAARTGSLESAEPLLAAGAELHVSEPRYGYTPLMTAVANRQEAFVRLLIEAGADVNDGSLYLALDNRDAPQLFELLLASGADPNRVYTKGIARLNGRRARAPKGATPLYLAATQGDYDAMRSLLDAGADASVTTADGTAPLLIMVGLGRRNGLNLIYGEPLKDEPDRLEMVQTLLAAGADINAVHQPTGNTALHIAAWNRAQTIYDVLMNAGAALDVENREGNTPEDLFTAEPFSRSPLG